MEEPEDTDVRCRYDPRSRKAGVEEFRERLAWKVIPTCLLADVEIQEQMQIDQKNSTRAEVEARIGVLRGMLLYRSAEFWKEEHKAGRVS